MWEADIKIPKGFACPTSLHTEKVMPQLPLLASSICSQPFISNRSWAFYPLYFRMCTCKSSRYKKSSSSRRQPKYSQAGAMLWLPAASSPSPASSAGDVDMVFIRALLFCMNPLKGATPVPGPIMMTGLLRSWGGLKSVDLKVIETGVWWEGGRGRGGSSGANMV